jgi:hypothetical protein
MAEEKKSIILYVDVISTFEELSDEEAGKLIKHIFRYVNDQNPTPPDRITKIAFEPIKQQLKRDLKRWESIKLKRSAAGLASAEKRKQDAANSTHVDKSKQVSTLSTVSVNDSVSVNVNDNVTVNVTYLMVESEFKNADAWKESLQKLLKKDLPATNGLIDSFLAEIKITEEFHKYKNIQEAKNHCFRWIKLQLTKKENGKSNQPGLAEHLTQGKRAGKF